MPREPKWDRVLTSAARLFAEDGFAATSVRAVAERARLTKAGLYYHINEKEDLLFRICEHSIQEILDGLGWLGIDWDEGPYFQSRNVDRHRGAVARLLDAGAAYACFCTVEELAAEREAAIARKESYVYSRRCRALDPSEAADRRANGEPHTIRFAVPPEQPRS